ncbi:ROK family protein [Starkeya koreensis]|uniref:ROK family protein n=1 Tax=Ancylobacter koreensis TaxID=266121 RepID=A0ABT0DI59_9HYPH|nr:ROK family protein [Ancylobacter koreensis]MCK0206968.1 ROK family protein [Ancylobacter koreensis]
MTTSEKTTSEKNKGAKKSETRAKETPPALGVHGAATLASVTVDACNSQLREEDGFLGDRARRAAFFEGLERWRVLADGEGKGRKDRGKDDDGKDGDGKDGDGKDDNGKDEDVSPRFGDTPTPELSKSLIDDVLIKGEPREQAVVHSAMEDYAQDLAAVLRRLLRTKDWRDTERVAVGGGLTSGRFAALAIARAELLLRADEVKVELQPIRNHPDEAGLIGAAHLAPSWMFGSFDDILAVDIGGTNIRAGIVKLNLGKADDLSKARVRTLELWRHRDDETHRDDAVERLVDMLRGLIDKAGKEGLKLAPFIGVACPGAIDADGSIEAGAQNLPGNWESQRFNLPAALWDAIPEIDGHETAVVMHNDAVVQGLSETPFMQDVERWGVLTIGTGLGNARFTNRARPGGAGEKDRKAKDAKGGDAKGKGRKDGDKKGDGGKG